MSEYTLGGQVQRFLQIKDNPQTRTWYTKYLAPMIEHLGAETPVKAVTRNDAEAYWLAVQRRKSVWEDHPTKPTRRRPLSPATLSNHLRAARAFWSAQVRQRVVEFNPFDHLKSPRDTRPVTMKAVNAEDLRALRLAAQESSTRDYALITVMATTGVRAGELVSMNLGQLDLRQGIVWVQGKRGWRKVFLGREAVEAVHAYLSDRPPGRDDALWLNVFGQPITTDGIRQLVDRLAKKANVRGRHNLHAFRHRAAQSWLDQGINAGIVAQALGHADVTVTLQIYGNQDDVRVAQAMRQAEMAPFEDPLGLDELGIESKRIAPAHTGRKGQKG